MPAFASDPLFRGLAALGPVGWLVLAFAGPPLAPGLPAASHLAAAVLLAPLLEEYVFRGLLQGALLSRPFFARRRAGISVANLSTSLAFAAAHLWSQPPLMAASVFLPSLVFGFCRDRYGRLLPGMLIHAFYNAGFLVLYAGGS